MSITLFCLIHGNTLKHAFPVRIKKNETVGELKELIKKKNEQTFASIDAKDLSLWKVNIPLGSPNNKQSALEGDPKVDIATVLEGDTLSPVDDIKEHFDKPAKKHIHIIVELPASFASINQASPYLSQDVITEIHEIHNKLTQPTIETISISKINTEKFQLLKNHLNLKVENVTFNNIPIHSNLTPPAFEWKDRSEPAHKNEYLGWLRKYIPLINGRVWHDVGGNNNLLDVYKDPRLPFSVHGGTDVVVVNDYDVASHLIPESIYAVLELKKKIDRKHVMQVILEMVIADLITSDSRIVFGVLSDLRDDWHIYWLEKDKKIKSWKAPSRDVAVQVLSELLGDSSKVDLGNTSTIIPAAKRVKLDTLLPNRTVGDEDDIARMEDVYDVMSKEEIWHHKVRIASEIVRNVPSFSSMYA